MNKQNVCRLCSIKTDDYLEIFKENGKRLRIAEVISQHFWFEIAEPNADYLDIVCIQCWSRLSDFHQFYTDIEKVHGHLSLQNVKVEVEADSHNYDLFLDDDKSVDDLNCKLFIDTKLNTLNFDEPNELKIKIRKHKKPDRKIKIEKGIKGTRKPVNVVASNEKKDYARDKQNEYYRTFFNMDCEICNEKLLSFDKIRKHYQTVHKETGYVRCCSKKFFSQRTMKQHIAEHVQPKSLKCDYCQKGFTLKTRLRDHLLTHIDPEHRPFKCDKCERTFIKQCQLTEHQKVKHSDNVEKKFGCDKCDKRFVLQYLLQNHKTQAHGMKDSFICDVCAKGFSTYSNYMAHKKIVHDKVMPQVQCEVCGIWLTNRYNLKKHTNIHTDGEQTCQYCFRVLKNRRTLRKHCAEVHSQRKLFICNLCGKEYRRALNLQEHMSSHTGAVLYSCLFCSKTFNSSANMYKHRKTVHPSEYKKIKEFGGPGILNSAVGLLPISVINQNHEFTVKMVPDTKQSLQQSLQTPDTVIPKQNTCESNNFTSLTIINPKQEITVDELMPMV